MVSTVQAGCTAVVAVVKGNELWVANAGDSRAVLCRGGQALALSEDHKPQSETERNRITAAGGFVSDVGGVSRSASPASHALPHPLCQGLCTRCFVHACSSARCAHVRSTIHCKVPRMSLKGCELCRVNGNLNLSRAIGDLKYKGNEKLAPAEQIITAQPDIVKVAAPSFHRQSNTSLLAGPFKDPS